MKQFFDTFRQGNVKLVKDQIERVRNSGKEIKVGTWNSHSQKTDLSRFWCYAVALPSVNMSFRCSETSAERRWVVALGSLFQTDHGRASLREVSCEVCCHT